MRLKFLLVIFFTVWAILIGRIYLISIKSNDRYSDLAQRNTIKSEPLVPVRGMIYDRNGVPLAVNRLGFSISLTEHLSYKSRRDVLDYYLDLIVDSFKGLDRQELLDAYLKADSPYYHDYVNVVQFIPYEEMLPQFTKLSQHEDIKIAPTTLRYYPHGLVASHVLGYVAKSNAKSGVEKVIGFEGKSGIESFYNTALQGQLGERVYQVTAKNEEIAEISRTEPSKNQDLYLNIDVRLQELLNKIFNGIEGVAIVMDANDGSILAAGSFPEYDINKFVTGISSKEWKDLIDDLHHPFLNKMVNSLYPPGSVIKQTVSLAFMESPFIDEKTDFFCSGSYLFGNRNFRCWKTSGHGHTTVRKAIRESCDIFFYKGSYQVGVNEIAKKLMDFGFGRKTGVDLPNEFIGIVPNKEWKLKRYGKSWFVGETFITSIGQGSFLATPMQIARNTALIATGKLSEPKFAKRLSGRVIDPVVNEDVFTPSDKKHIGVVRQALADVTSTPYGTAYRYLQVPLLVAGKTGTAQVVGMAQEEKTRIKESELEYYKRSHAYMTTYAPFKNPKYVVTVLVEHGGHGGSAAGPIVTEIYNKLMELGYL